MRKKKSFKDISILSSNLGMLNNEGLSISKAIYLLKDFPISKKYKESLNLISLEIEKGKSLYEAFSNRKDLFPKFYLSMLKSAEETGKVDDIFNRLGEYYSEIDRIKKDLISSLIYPISVLISVILIFNLFVFLIIPNFENMIDINKNNLPFLTKFILEFSEFFRENIFFIFILSFLWGFTMWEIFLKGKIKTILLFLLEKFSLTKSIVEYKTIMTLNTIISSGINLSKGLLICSDEENEKENIFYSIYYLINRGNTLTEALKKSSKLSEYSLSMIQIGEESGSLDKSISKVTTILKERNKMKLSNMTKIMQPVIILFVSFIVLIFILTFILPMFELLYSGGV